MPLSLAEFARKRPFLYHLTCTHNARLIDLSRELVCAATLQRQAGRANRIGRRRASHERLTLPGGDVWLRDQEPLREGNIAFAPGWNFARFVALLDEHVFFWPGTEQGPIDYGGRHYERYKHESPLLLRV